jgi:hypothetical protein
MSEREMDLGEEELGDTELDRDDTHAVDELELQEPSDADEAAEIAEGHS